MYIAYAHIRFLIAKCAACSTSFTALLVCLPFLDATIVVFYFAAFNSCCVAKRSGPSLRSSAAATQPQPVCDQETPFGRH